MANRNLNAPKKRVLVIDDDETNLDIVDEYLEGSIFRPSYAKNGEKALEIILFEAVNNRLFDLILVDWNMPTMDGLEFHKNLQEDSRFSKIPVVMVTAVATKEEVSKAIKAGIKYYVRKPFTQDALISTLFQVLRESKNN